MKHIVYNLSWWLVFSVNLCAVVMSFASPWGARDEVSTSVSLLALILLWLSALAANAIVTDMAAEFICILLGAAKVHVNDMSRTLRVAPVEVRPPDEPYIVVYCLKSKVLADIDNTLRSLEKSWRGNKGYSNAVYLILSGTSNEELYLREMEAIRAWNISHEESGVVCKYLRRNRSILFKYGQYLDFIMLLNGHDGTGGESSFALFKDTLPEDGSGCFDASTDIDYFKGRLEFDRLVVLDKDNVLGVDFFEKANVVYEKSNIDIDIIQPAVVPPDFETRTSDGSATVYGSFIIASHNLSSKMEPFREKFFPSATFFGKGIIRRTKYNDILFGYSSETHATKEDARLPRDIVSHDIVESSIMTCVKDTSLEIVEGFPNTCLEWHLRQCRWDRGDLILSKYLFPWSFGLPANVLSRFSYSRCIPFYRSFASQSTVHTGTFNARVTVVRPLIALSFFLYTRIGENTMFLVVLGLYNLEILLIPFVVKLATTTSFYTVLLLTIHDAYMGAIDIYYGTARTIRALAYIACGIGGWTTFGEEAHTPLITTLRFCRAVLTELVIAIGVEVWFIVKSFDEQGEFRETYLALVVWLGLVICHPIYVYTTARKL